MGKEAHKPETFRWARMPARALKCVTGALHTEDWYCRIQEAVCTLMCQYASHHRSLLSLLPVIRKEFLWQRGIGFTIFWGSQAFVQLLEFGVPLLTGPEAFTAFWVRRRRHGLHGLSRSLARWRKTEEGRQEQKDYKVVIIQLTRWKKRQQEAWQQHNQI